MERDHALSLPSLTAHVSWSLRQEALLLCPKCLVILESWVSSSRNRLTNLSKKGYTGHLSACPVPGKGGPGEGAPLGCCPLRTSLVCPRVRLLEESAGPAWQGPSAPPLGRVNQPGHRVNQSWAQTGLLGQLYPLWIRLNPESLNINSQSPLLHECSMYSLCWDTKTQVPPPLGSLPPPD